MPQPFLPRRTVMLASPLRAATLHVGNVGRPATLQPTVVDRLRLAIMRECGWQQSCIDVCVCLREARMVEKGVAQKAVASRSLGLGAITAASGAT